MPHINRIRVNNVKYNFGTQFYDDFLMRFSCKNTIYDLANGGGKSVLMLLLLQNLIPNCTLDDKQPIEKLFRTNEGSTTIHSLIEWSLSDAHIKDGFKYMLTGFCARKAKENGSEAEENNAVHKSGTAIEYFNYCIFYRTFNDNDIKNLPLSKNGERVTYNGLKNYLKELQKNDYHLEVKIFERKGDYQRFIAEYGLYESEWEIIRGINKTEGHVRTYFETNYKTTRKVVEDLLIEEIIEKSFRNKYAEENSEGNLAETFLNIKDKLVELSEKKEEIQNYDRQIEIIDGFTERVGSIRLLYHGIEEEFAKLKKANNSLEHAMVQNRTELEGMMEQQEAVTAEKNQLSKKIETAKVLVDMKELEELTDRLARETQDFQTLEEEIHEINDKLNLYEGGNYYLEYLACKKEYDQLKLVMDNILKDNHTLLADLKRLVAAKKLDNENKENTLAGEIEREIAISDKEADNLKELGKKNRELDNQSAVCSYQLQSCEQELQTIDKSIMELKNTTSMLLPTDAIQLLEDNARRIEHRKKRIEEDEAEYGTIEEHIVSLRLKVQEKQYEQNRFMAEREKIQSAGKTLLNEYEKITKLKEVYGQKDFTKLKEAVEKIYKNMVSAINDLAAQITQTEEQIKALEAGKISKESKEFEEVLDYIRRYHSDSALSGMEYMGTLDDERRVKAVRACPVLPYAVIVYQDFLQVVSDDRLKTILKEGYSIPIINGEYLSSEDSGEILPVDRMAYITFAPEEYTDDKLRIRREKLQQEAETLQKKYIRQCENEQVVKEDYIFLCKVAESGLKEEQFNPAVISEDVEQNILRLKDEIEQLNSDIRTEEKKKAALSQAMRNAETETEQLTQELQALTKIRELLDKRDVTEARLDEYKTEKALIQKELSDGQKRYEALQNMNHQREQRIRSMEQELRNIESMWDKRYRSYYDEAIYHALVKQPDKKKELLSKDLDIELQAVLESLKRENTAVADKETLLSNYQISMQRSLEHIDYMGVDVNIFRNMYDNNELVQTTSRELSEIKHRSSTLREKKKGLRRQLQETRSVKDKLQGKITHAVSIIQEKYGEFREELVASGEIDTFLNENGVILSELEKRYNSLTTGIKQYESRGITLEILKRDITKLMAKSEVKADIHAGMLDDDCDVEQECKDIAEQLDRFIEEKYKRGENFEKEMVLLNDTLKKLNAHELASEIRMNVQMPANLRETEDLIEMLKETTQYIELEKQRIIKGLDDIQIIKDNFENQCIQSCINIRTELNRLTKLSKITMEDERISIINLRIPYVKEEFYKDRMSDYIDRIAKGTDNFDNAEDKLKYIRNNLCWKKMFSVIVTDMNAIRLNLYKRERIADQSRYLPYEEAVGSTGQSQGIYIQFLIAIINYISSIHSGNADTSRLKKVIFIDNPFGAAKDVYIWEPIFKLLKTNNVQLIVPARGATPAITGRFDVNYVLGQKMCDGRQQTVVVDYFSHVNQEELDYTTLSYEQAALF